MIVKTYHINTIDITQIISILNPNLSLPKVFILHIFSIKCYI